MAVKDRLRRVGQTLGANTDTEAVQIARRYHLTSEPLS